MIWKSVNNNRIRDLGKRQGAYVYDWKDHQELLEYLRQAISEWENSPYYIPEKELFDLEGFLKDHKALELKKELESVYGEPLNDKFWTSSLAYHRLKRARQEVKEQEDLQDEKRRRYLEAVEEGKKEWDKWLNEWITNQRRQQMRIIPGGKDKTSEES
jgi:hypothetical protein